MTSARDGRLHAPVVTAAVAETEVRAPGVGLWRPSCAIGDAVRAGDAIGELSVLGTIIRVIAGDGARGAVVKVTGGGRAHTPVDHGSVLLVLDPTAGFTAGAGAGAHAATTDAATGGLVLRAPSSGRFYGRPAPGKPPFVVAGDRVKLGQTVCMLEVMKTFHRVTYGGGGLPDEARVVAVAIADEADVNPGDVLLRLEPI